MRSHPNARTTPVSRRVLVLRVLREGWSVGDVAEAHAISSRTVYRWLRRYREEGEAGLFDRSSRPRRSPRRTKRPVERRIERLRRGMRLTGRAIAKRIGMAASTVSAVLRRLGLGRLKQLEPPVPVVRYEKDRPGELLHLDTKKLGRIRGVGHRIHGDKRTRQRGIGWEFAHVCVDDATRLAYVEVLADETAASAAGFLRRALTWMKRQGIQAERLLTDNGSCYISHRFAGEVARAELRHSFTRPYRPQTNGKAERFIQTMIRGWAYRRPYRSSAERARALGPWLDFYNHQREHRGIQSMTPIAKLRMIR